MIQLVLLRQLVQLRLEFLQDLLDQLHQHCLEFLLVQLLLSFLERQQDQLHQLHQHLHLKLLANLRLLKDYQQYYLGFQQRLNFLHFLQI